MKYSYPLVIALLLLLPVSLFAQWDTAGHSWPYYPQVGGCKLAADNKGNVYLAYEEVDYNDNGSEYYILDVSKLVNNDWVSLGAVFNTSDYGTYSQFSLITDTAGNVFVGTSVIDNVNIYEYFPTQNRWVSIGDFVPEDEEYSCPMAIANGVLYMAYMGNLTQQLTIERYNGTGWTMLRRVGLTYSDEGALAADPATGALYLAYRDYSSYQDLSHQKFGSVINVSTGNYVGDSLFTGEVISGTELCVDSSGDIFMSYFNNSGQLKVMKYDTTWADFGTLGTGEYYTLYYRTNYQSSISIGPGNRVYVAFPGVNGEHVLSRPVDGSSGWEPVGSPTINGPQAYCGGMAIDVQQTIYVCYADSPANNMLVFKYTCVPDVPTLAATNAFVCPGTQTELSITSGNLHSGRQWYWFTDSCQCTFVDSGVVIPVTPLAPTTYYAKGIGGCGVQDNSAFITIAIDSEVAASVTITAAADTVCSFTPVTFTALAVNGGPAPVYNWRRNGQTVGGNSYQYVDNNLQNGDTITCHLISSLCTGSYSQGSNPVSVYVIAPAEIVANGPLNFCAGDSITLMDGNIATGYRWSNGSAASFISVKQTGTYSVTVNNANCSSTDSISVTAGNSLKPSIVQSPAVFCDGGLVNLDGGSGYASYAWSTGDTTGSIIIDSAGIYSLTVTQGACTGYVKDTIAFNNLTIKINGGATTLQACSGDTILLAADANLGSYLWNNGAQGQNIYVTGTGVYSLTVAGNGCTDSASITVEFSPKLVPVIVSTDSVFILCQSGILHLTTNAAYDSYLWSNNQTTRTIMPADTGVYTVIVTSNGCIGAAASPSVISNPLPDSVMVSLTPIPYYRALLISSVTNAQNYQWQFSNYENEWGFFPNVTDSPNSDSLAVYCYFIGEEPLQSDTVQGGSFIRVIVSTGGCADTSGWLYLSTTCQFFGAVNDLDHLSDIRIYPNPCANQLNIAYQLENSTEIQLNVFNIAGQKVITLPETRGIGGTNNQIINTGLLPAGVYMVQIAKPGGYLNAKFVKLNN